MKANDLCAIMVGAANCYNNVYHDIRDTLLTKGYTKSQIYKAMDMLDSNTSSDEEIGQLIVDYVVGAISEQIEAIKEGE